MAKERAVKCIVQLFLLEVQWNDNQGSVVHLEGPPVVVRVCLLGQLQHSHLHSSIFPIKLEQELNFERVVTNCRNPLMFGEHVHIELIQLSGDYKGGKVIARHEEKAHHFLFPTEQQEDKPREVVMSKGRRFESPPRLVFTTSTTLTEAIVHSPLDATLPPRCSSSDETHSSLTSNSNNTGDIPAHRTVGMHKSVQTDSGGRQRVVLDYSRFSRDKFGQISGESSSDEPQAVAAMTASNYNRFSRNDSSSSASDQSSPVKVKFQPKVATKFGSREQSGPHCYQCCPRQASLPASAASVHHHSISPASLKLDYSQHRSSATNSEPFICGGCVDKSLLAQRDFPKLTKHKTRLKKNGLQVSSSSATPKANNDHKPMLSLSVPTKSSTVVRQEVTTKPEPSLSELYNRYLNDEGTVQLTKEQLKMSPTPSFSPIPHKSPVKYKQPHQDLKLHPGNKREGIDSPSQLIQRKVDRMLRDYCACRHDVDTLGDDSPRTEGDKLRVSLAAQRNAGLATSQPRPDQRVSVALGGGDYWTDKMAEFTGKPHRVVFNDTMEKIYSRLYTNASSSSPPKKGSLD
ncbi:spermatogenesis-associated protein 6-like isoform X2 [Dysidea avara]|uniref:spermatogenesis-associated protein 6-like isoform X2 n=1 Tax=Dysidea avara TaxID=196820 RepID=UPI00331FB5A6